MQKKIKLLILLLLKFFGIFSVARWFTRKDVRVLCYHGFSYLDEHHFRPKLFMTPELFAKRLQWLTSQNNYQIVSLEQAIKERGSKNYQVAITMDDGWASTYELVFDTLKKHQLPVTLYITSYYADNQQTVFNVAIAYILWKTPKTSITLPENIFIHASSYNLCKQPRQEIIDSLNTQVSQLKTAEQREAALYEIAKLFDVSLGVDGKRIFRLLNRQEINTLKKTANVDMQLHSHRHCSPKEQSLFNKELTDNKDYLLQIFPSANLVHYCYPSGEYYEIQAEWLEQQGVISATTTVRGLFTGTSNKFQIPRILDGENMHQLELEFEMSGLRELILGTESYE
ncbi:polysaccharide deacetylase family protein [Colwelliaceae bacterium 6471]